MTFDHFMEMYLTIVTLIVFGFVLGAVLGGK